MPSSIHPPVYLHIVLDEKNYDRGDSVGMARRFTAVAPTEVVRASKGSQRSNVLRFDFGEDEATAEVFSNDLWRDALISWLDEEFAETSALVARENDARKNNGLPLVPFQWAEVKFGMGPVIAIRMIDSAIPKAAAGYVAHARMLLARGAFGADPISSIRIPACAAIDEQKIDAQQDEPQAGDEGWPAVDPDAQNAWAASAVQRDEPTRLEIEDALAEAEEALRQGVSPTDVVDVSESLSDEESAGYRPGSPDVDFEEACALTDEDVPEDLDFRIWNVAYADGTSVRFDSVLGEAILD